MLHGVICPGEGELNGPFNPVREDFLSEEVPKVPRVPKMPGVIDCDQL